MDSFHNHRAKGWAERTLQHTGDARDAGEPYPHGLLKNLQLQEKRQGHSLGGGGNRPAPASLVHPPKAGPELQDPRDRAGGLGRWEGQSPPTQPPTTQLSVSLKRDCSCQAARTRAGERNCPLASLKSRAAVNLCPSETASPVPGGFPGPGRAFGNTGGGLRRCRRAAGTRARLCSARCTQAGG